MVLFYTCVCMHAHVCNIFRQERKTRTKKEKGREFRDANISDLLIVFILSIGTSCLMLIVCDM